MFGRNGRRPSAGVVIGVIALVFALAGGAYAAQELTKKQVTKIAKKQANKQINKRAAGLSVSSAQTAANAANADRLGGKTLREISLWAIWESDGDLVRSSGGVTSGQVDTGRYKVTFPIDVSQCVYSGNAGSPAANNDATDFAERLMMVGPDAADPKSVQVEIANAGGGEANNPGFLSVQC